MFEFTLTKVSPLGEDDPQYGQRYWGSAEGSDLEISFNLVGQTVHAGSKITADEKLIKMTKPKEGKPSREYIFLKKVKVLDAQLPTSHTTASVPEYTTSKTVDFDAVMQTLKEINVKIDKLLGLDSSDPEQAHAQAEAKRDAATFSSGEPLPEYFEDGEVL